MLRIKNRCDLISTTLYGWHKGFYNDEDYSDSLAKIRYEDFFEYPDDDEFPYSSAYLLLKGSCHHFALALEKVLGYTPYIIQGNDKKGFHAFCQLYKNRKWFYVDARGITSSFDELLFGIREFVGDEYTIRTVAEGDLEDWKKDSNYDDEAMAFAEAVIKKYKECYIL